MRISASFALLIVTATLPVPAQCTIDQDAVWVHGGGSLVAYTLTGCVLHQIPSASGGCWSIAVDGRRQVWTSDHAPGSNTVSKFSHAGKHLGTFPAGPAAAAGQSTVGPLAIDRFDHVYVGDPSPGGNHLTKLDNDGARLATWTTAGTSIRAISVDQDGNVWVLSGGNLQKFSPGGTALVQIPIPPPAAPDALYADEWGRITLSGHPRPNCFTRFGLDGSAILSTESTPVLGDHGMNSIGVAPDGKTWVAEAVLRRIETFGPSGDSRASGLTGNGPATGIAFDSQGNTWAAVPQGTGAGSPVHLQLWSPEGAPVLSLVVPGMAARGVFSSSGDPTGMLRVRTVDPTGDMDGDGHENYAEFIAGTSPLSSIQRTTSLVFQNVPRIGTTFQMTISVNNASGQEYFMPCSLNPSDLPLSLIDPRDPRRFPISIFRNQGAPALDPMWVASTSGIPPWTTVFPDTRGTLGGAGAALIRFAIPRLPSLIGTQVYAAFCTLDPAARSGVKAVSPQISFVIQ